MTDFLIAFMAIATVALGFFAYIKFQRATGGPPDTDKVVRKGSSPLPRELRELQIEPPQENMLDRPEEPTRKSQGQKGTFGHPAS